MRRQEDRLTRRIGIAWAHLSYAGVRVFGGIARWCYRIGLVVLLAAMVGGCGGCMGNIVDGFDSPVYEQTGGE